MGCNLDSLCCATPGNRKQTVLPFLKIAIILPDRGVHTHIYECSSALAFPQM